MRYHKHAREATLRRLERHSLEVDPESQFFVISQRQRVPLERYIRNWQWDDAKYPKSRGISENCGVLLVNVGKLDDEARNKMAQYSDLRAQAASVGKKNESASLVTRELVDLLTPTLVRTEHNHTDDFIYSERMTTVLVVIPRGCEDEFLKCYENFPDADEVVPMSAKQFRGVDDRDGNSLWRVVMFKASVEPFKKACKARRFVTRDFTYSEENYRKLVAQRGQLEDEAAKQHRVIKSVFQATWSDVMVAWVHLKALFQGSPLERCAPATQLSLRSNLFSHSWSCAHADLRYVRPELQSERKEARQVSQFTV